VCRALRVLCAAPDLGSLDELKRASVSAHWELVGGAASVERLLLELGERNPDVVVIDARLGSDAEALARQAGPNLRILRIGDPASDGQTVPLAAVRDAIMGLPAPGGPIRR
jgi:hypothetical protein